MFKTLIDNSTNALSMVETLKKCLAEPELDEVDIATGYWDIPGLALVAKELDLFLQRPNSKLNLLIGKDPYVYAYQVKEPKYKDSSFPDDFIRTDIQSLDLKDEYQEAVKVLLKYCDKTDNSKIQIRIFRKNDKDETQFLHSKCYIFKNISHSYGIIGSSNFTQKGLEGNAELNHFDNDPSFVLAEPKDGAPAKGHRFWFFEKWNMSEPWNNVFLEQILKSTPIGKKVEKDINDELKKDSFTPYDLYIRYLQNQFGDIADSSQDATLLSYLPEKYDHYTYQLDAVKQCFFIMKNFNGFILADVVGLGKTVVGTLIIKKFIEEHDLYDNRSQNVLIVTPPAIKGGWEDTIRDFDTDAATPIRPNIDFITTGSIGNVLYGENEDENSESDDFNETLEQKNYGLIIVDESHNFRNDKTNKYQQLDELISRIALNGPAPFVGLLSATPQNNSPKDIYNQIKFFERTPSNTKLPTIEGGKLDSFFSEREKIFKESRKQEDRREAKVRLKYLSQEIREKVLDQLLVRRTRTDIKKYYSRYEENLTFPEVKGPHKLEYVMDIAMANLFYETINAILPSGDLDVDKHLGYHRYQAIRYFKDEKNKRFYEKNNLTVEVSSEQLATMMKKLLVKRMESSIPAFKRTLNSLLVATRNMITMIERDCVFICPDFDVNKEFHTKDDEAEILPFSVVCENIRKRMVKKKGNNKEYKASDFKDEYIVRLREDERILSKLCTCWNRESYDPKLETFKECLREELFDKRRNTSQKLVIFTEAVDTLKELEKVIKNIRLRNNRRLHPLAISASNRDEMQKVIKENFDANYGKKPGEVQKNDYDVIITTEVLAEGVNLHRANVILNYDTPWNATRLMQRIGRVNRIGSTEPFVHVYNFYPSATGNEQLMLVEIAFAKLQTFHTMFGEDNKIYSDEEEISEANFTQKFDGEESPYSKYISELKIFQENEPERFLQLKEMPLENIGGQIIGECSEGYFAIRSEQQGLLNMKLLADGTAKSISPLEFAAHLKEQSVKEFANEVNQDMYNSMKDGAIFEFSKHIVHVVHAKDVKKKQVDALSCVSIIRPMLRDDEARKALKAAELAIKDKQLDVIKAVLKWKESYDYGGISFFGTDYDINEWVKNAFKVIKQKATMKKGEAYVALYEMN